MQRNKKGPKIWAFMCPDKNLAVHHYVFLPISQNQENSNFALDFHDFQNTESET